MRGLWLKPALLGVDSAAMLPVEGELGALIAHVSEDADPALGFSRSAGVLAACSLAATTLEPAAGSAPLPADADPRVLPEPHSWAAALSMAFDRDGFQQSHDLRVKFEACMRLRLLDATLPHALLPRALDAGQRNAALRPAVLPVLGSRGQWLADQNPDWAYASASGGPSAGAGSSGTWLDGQHHERLAWFRELRANDAGKARDLLRAGLGELPAKERLDFVNALEAGLHDDDTTLLEPLLKDRSRDVRFAAARLLARLPQSGHARQLIGWIAPLVVPKKGLLTKGWQIEPPADADPAWAAAAIETKRPQYETLGERAWWLYQLVRQVPLDWWTSHTGMGPDELVAWAGKTDWKAALWRGWRERVGPEEPDWIEALLRLRDREFHNDRAQLLGMLPVAQREKHWPGDVGELCAEGVIGDVIASHALGDMLSATYSAGLFPSLLECFASDRLRQDYVLRAYVLDLAAIVHPDVLRNAPAIARPADETPAMAECATEFERIIRIRAALHTQP
jgi:hypothetical protein